MKNLIIFACIFLEGCIAFEPLTFKKEEFLGKNLKADGYFYYTNKKQEYNAFFLYKNGVYHGGNWLKKIDFNINNLNLLDKDIKTIYEIEEKYPTYYRWGIFNVNNSNIEIERWVTSSGGGPYPTQILRGEIKNDSTIHFHTKLESVPLQANRKKKIFSIDETYHFRQFSPKPDSTNKFIK
jgi:hypothetical protein